MKLSTLLHSKIVDFLRSLPSIDDTKGRRAFIYSAGLDLRLKEQIPFDEPPAQFIPLLVEMLLDYGKLADGSEPLESVLRATQNYIGHDNQKYCNELIQELHAHKNADFCTSDVIAQNSINPFFASGLPLPHNAPSYIRRKCDKELSTAIETKKLIAINGDFRIGKSSLMNQIMVSSAFGGSSWKYCYITLEGMNTHDIGYFMEEFFCEISEVLERDIHSWKELAYTTENQPMVLCIDEFGWLTPHLATMLIPKLYWLTCNEDKEIRIVICLPTTIKDFLRGLNDKSLRNPKYSHAWHSILIESFEKKEMQKLINLLPETSFKVACEHLDAIIKNSKGKPWYLQCLCYRLFELECNRGTEEELVASINTMESYK